MEKNKKAKKLENNNCIFWFRAPQPQFVLIFVSFTLTVLRKFGLA